jgi:hypothetical protein
VFENWPRRRRVFFRIVDPLLDAAALKVLVNVFFREDDLGGTYPIVRKAACGH